MQIKISTRVQAPLKQVIDGFTQDLFLDLNPPFPPVKLLQFDGCHKDDVVALELNFIFFKQLWKSLITHDEKSERHFLFVDEGVKLPFFLKSWKHRHLLQTQDQGTEIIDDIEYSTGSLLTDILFYPVLLGQFLYRKPVYKKVFSGK